MGSKWFRRYAAGSGQHTGDGPRLVCFPHAGGAASAYVSLSRQLAALDVLAVQYPGRQDRRRDEPIADIARLADALADEVVRHCETPYAFFGHSMGAVLAYETARRLRERQAPAPVRLFLSGRGAPTPAPSRHDQLRTDAELLSAVTRLGGTATQVLDDPEVREMILPALRADYQALGSYTWVPGPALSIPFTVLIGDADPVVTVAEAAAWEDFTTASTDLHVFTGGHFYLDGQTREVAGTVSKALSMPAPPSSSAPLAAS
ncbi:alpha/beta fold hydrolase [Streptomyces sp. NPDC050619]|uniref:thioesterase II family protein n=1 Tax=Streptomyces sp. NPDC050619 TaxID=3157214 RepID=UPI00341C0F83